MTEAQEIRGTSSPTHLSVERESQFRAMMLLYKPPISLKKHNKDYLKTAWSVRDGYDGTKLGCSFCKKVGNFGEITIHHKDGNESHNDPDNLAPACWDCHMKEGWIVRRRRKAEASELERERLKLAHAPEPQRTPMESESLIRHKRERMEFNLWLYHPVKGIATQGSVFSRMGVAMKAVDIVGIGSHKTYLGYVDEDIAGDYWIKFEDAKTGTMIERSAKPFPRERMGMKASDEKPAQSQEQE